MSHNKALDDLTREQLTELLEIYSKNWLAADGIWFQSVEKKHGMEEAMYHDVEIWKKFTVVEALKLKKFLRRSCATCQDLRRAAILLSGRNADTPCCHTDVRQQ